MPPQQAVTFKPEDIDPEAPSTHLAGNQIIQNAEGLIQSAPASGTVTFKEGDIDRAPDAHTTIMDSLINGVVDYGKALNRTSNPASEENRAGSYGLVVHPIDTMANALKAQGSLYEAAKESFQNKDYLQGVRHAISYLIPILGPAIDEAGNKAGTGHLAEGLGEATGIGLNAALTAKGLQNQPPDYGPPAPKTSARVTDLYRTALKRGVKSTEDVGDVRKLAETGLQYGIPVSEEGVQKLSGLIADVEEKVKAATQAATDRGVTIDKYKVLGPIGDLERKAGVQATPGGDLASIASARKEFLSAHPDEMPADYAQAVKQGTYRSIGDKAYGELKSASVEAQKALARGIKDELAAKVPEIAELTPEQGKMIDLQGALERAVNKQANLQGSIFRETVTGVATRALTGSDAAGVVAGVLRHVFKDPEFQSKLATTIYRAQQNNPGKWGAPNIKTALVRANTLLDGVKGQASPGTAQ